MAYDYDRIDELGQGLTAADLGGWDEASKFGGYTSCALRALADSIDLGKVSEPARMVASLRELLRESEESLPPETK